MRYFRAHSPKRPSATKGWLPAHTILDRTAHLSYSMYPASMKCGMLSSPFLTTLSCLSSHSFTGPFTSDCAPPRLSDPTSATAAGAKTNAKIRYAHTSGVCDSIYIHRCGSYMPRTRRAKKSKKTLTKGTSLVNCCVRQRRPTASKKKRTRETRGAIQHRYMPGDEKITRHRHNGSEGRGGW